MKLNSDDKQRADHTRILDHTKEIYKTFFKNQEVKTVAETKYLYYLSIYLFSVISTLQNFPKIKQNLLRRIQREDLYKSMKMIQKNKSPTNNKLAQEFYKDFWDKLNSILADFVSKAGEMEHLRLFKAHAAVKLV